MVFCAFSAARRGPSENLPRDGRRYDTTICTVYHTVHHCRKSCFKNSGGSSARVNSEFVPEDRDFFTTVRNKQQHCPEI